MYVLYMEYPFVCSEGEKKTGSLFMTHYEAIETERERKRERDRDRVKSHFRAERRKTFKSESLFPFKNELSGKKCLFQTLDPPP